MNKVTITLTENQAKELPWIIRNYVRLDRVNQDKKYGLTEVDEQHYAFVRRIKTSIQKQLAKAKTNVTN